MNDTERKAALDRLAKFAKQQRGADELADKGSLDRAADVMALYEDRSWVAEVPPPKHPVNRGRPVDPESFSRFTKWLATKTPLAGSRAYQLREAHDTATNYLHQVETNPPGERSLRPLKWLKTHDYADRIPEVWNIAVGLAGGKTPDSGDVRKALTQWKHDNLPKSERKSGPRGGRALVDRWLRDAHRIMEEYPELFIPAVNRVEEEAEQYFAHEKVA